MQDTTIKNGFTQSSTLIKLESKDSYYCAVPFSFGFPDLDGLLTEATPDAGLFRVKNSPAWGSILVIQEPRAAAQYLRQLANLIENKAIGD